MRNRRSIDTIAILSAAAALVVMVLSSCEFAPRIDRRLHAEIGKALAKEALSLLGAGGQITVITRDTVTFRQPTLDILMKSFQREVRRAGRTIASTQLVQADPLRPADVPAGDFFELIRRSAPQHVIVSLFGPPLLTEEQRNKLGGVKPKIVAFCSGRLVENIDLRQLFNIGLLHAAVVSRQASSITSAASRNPPNAFDQLYQTIKAPDASTSQASPGLAQ